MKSSSKQKQKSENKSHRKTLFLIGIIPIRWEKTGLLWPLSVVNRWMFFAPQFIRIRLHFMFPLHIILIIFLKLTYNKLICLNCSSFSWGRDSNPFIHPFVPLQMKHDMVFVYFCNFVVINKGLMSCLLCSVLRLKYSG